MSQYSQCPLFDENRGNESSFIPINSTIWISINHIDPFTSNNVCLWRSRNQYLSVIHVKSNDFSLHNISPCWPFLGMKKRGWICIWMRGNMINHIIRERLWLTMFVTSTCNHGIRWTGRSDARWEGRRWWWMIRRWICRGYRKIHIRENDTRNWFWNMMGKVKRWKGNCGSKPLNYFWTHGEDCFMKGNVTRCVSTISTRVVAKVPFVRWYITKKDTWNIFWR